MIVSVVNASIVDVEITFNVIAKSRGGLAASEGVVEVGVGGDLCGRKMNFEGLI